MIIYSYIVLFQKLVIWFAIGCRSWGSSTFRVMVQFMFSKHMFCNYFVLHRTLVFCNLNSVFVKFISFFLKELDIILVFVLLNYLDFLIERQFVIILVSVL